VIAIPALALTVDLEVDALTVDVNMDQCHRRSLPVTVAAKSALALACMAVNVDVARARHHCRRLPVAVATPTPNDRLLLLIPVIPAALLSLFLAAAHDRTRQTMRERRRTKHDRMSTDSMRRKLFSFPSSIPLRISTGEATDFTALVLEGPLSQIKVPESSTAF
jgi:hypothetical protein